MRDPSDQATAGSGAPIGLDTSTSRRTFLKGVGLAAGAAVLSPPRVDAQQTATAEQAPGELQVLGHGLQTVTLNVNGESRTVRVEPRATLLDTLRMQLGLTGAKSVCDRGSCGACTVFSMAPPFTPACNWPSNAKAIKSPRWKASPRIRSMPA